MPVIALPAGGFSTVFYRNGITIYGAKPIYAPREFGFVRFAHSKLATLAIQILYPPVARKRDGESHPPARLVIASLRSL